MGTKTRVLHFVSGMNRGGVETFIMNIYRNIDRNLVQFDFAVLTEEKCDYDDEIRKLGGKIYSLSSITPNIFRYYKEVKNILKSNKEYKVAHLHTESSLSIINTLFLKICKIRVIIVHSHSTQTRNKTLHKILRPFIIKTCTHMFACSKDAGKWLFGKGIVDKGKVEIINNAVNVEKYSYNKEIEKKIKMELGIQNKIVIGHVGRFSPVKNHTFIIDVFKRINTLNKDTVLLLVGGGECEQMIRKKVDSNGLNENVMFLGVRSDVNELMQAMDIFIFPSIYEGLPVTLIEAQASGLPIVASDSITKESNITGLINFISLNQPKDMWANLIFKSIKNERVNKISLIQSKGYDIKEVSKNLQELYTNS